MARPLRAPPPHTPTAPWRQPSASSESGSRAPSAGLGLIGTARHAETLAGAAGAILRSAFMPEAICRLRRARREASLAARSKDGGRAGGAERGTRTRPTMRWVLSRLRAAASVTVSSPAAPSRCRALRQVSRGSGRRARGTGRRGAP